MKYKVGDKVRIKGLDFFNKNKGKLSFYVDSMALCFANEIVTIKSYGRYPNTYRIDEDEGDFLWTDEMIEGLVEEKSKYGTASYPVKPKSNANCLTRERVDELVEEEVDLIPKFGEYSDNEPLDIPTMTTEFVKEHGLPCPEDYIFKDENGNVINATKIVLEKKKKEYPKSYEECCKVMNYCYVPVPFKTTHKEELIRKFQFLLMYRDAYWKLYGEEKGLGKPWEPDYDSGVDKFGIVYFDNTIMKTCAMARWERHLNKILEFPTAEMRDAFYENFKELIESCKELL